MTYSNPAVVMRLAAAREELPEPVKLLEPIGVVPKEPSNIAGANTCVVGRYPVAPVPFRAGSASLELKDRHRAQPTSAKVGA